jgi:MFS family permease
MTANFTKKQRILFWAGLGFGIIGGILGNMFASLWTELFIKNVKTFLWGDILIWAVFVIITILLILFIFKMKNELKKASNTKEESPKRKN